MGVRSLLTFPFPKGALVKGALLRGALSVGALLVCGPSLPARGEEPPEAERRPAPVEALALAVLQSFPLQINATLRGTLPDACSSVEWVEELFVPEERTYRLRVTQVRQTAAVCAQSISEFEVTVPIVKAGLAAGEFRVEVGDETATFEIEPLGDFPGLSLPSGGAKVWTCVVEPRVCFAGPEEWKQDGLSWNSPEFLAARLGFRWWPDPARKPEELLPTGAELRHGSAARLGWTVGTRLQTSRDDGHLWSEHVFARCGDKGLCEFWVEAPSEPLLDAAGEDFAQLLRFAMRY